jgi:excinuclease UvrABC nuclease subunit
MMEQVLSPPRANHRQLRLFVTENPLGARLGAEFFRSLPSVPGVYFFRDREGQLLYIGQSNDLRARIGSYRHLSLERNPRRLLQMVQRIARVEWRQCGSAAEAVELERQLLLEHRPRFNRAGVWPGYAWWMTVHSAEGGIQINLSRHQQEGKGGCCVGPLPAGMRYVHASLMRCVFRYLNPDCPLDRYPLGLFNLMAPLSLHVEVEQGSVLAELIVKLVTGESDDLLEKLQSVVAGVHEGGLEYWKAEFDTLTRYFKKRRESSAALDMPLAQPLPMFPGM